MRELSRTLAHFVSPLPGQHSSPLAQSGSQTCTAVFVGGQFLLFDMGAGSRISINQLNLPLYELDAAFITHYHNDHFADLAEIIEYSWMNGRQKNLPVIGPTGLSKIVNGMQLSYSLDQEYRNAHHGDETLPLNAVTAIPQEFGVDNNQLNQIVYQKKGVVVKAFQVSHAPIDPAVGYRIEYNGKLIVISGDTIKTETLLKNSKNADILIAEAMNKNTIKNMEKAYRKAKDFFTAKLLHDILDYHIDVSELGHLAKQANVKRLVLTHLAPAGNSKSMSNRLYKKPIKKVFSGELDVGEDGLVIKL